LVLKGKQNFFAKRKEVIDKESNNGLRRDPHVEN
jgi:hypothetical protein